MQGRFERCYLLALQEAGARAAAGLHSTGIAELSTALDMIARLKRQLAERDREILDLKVLMLASLREQQCLLHGWTPGALSCASLVCAVMSHSPEIYQESGKGYATSSGAAAKMFCRWSA